MLIRPTASSLHPDAARDTPRGRVWPVLRSAMTDGHAILDRMAEEALALFRERGIDPEPGINESDFWRAGWSRAQVGAYGAQAIELAEQLLRKRHLPAPTAPEIRAPA